MIKLRRRKQFQGSVDLTPMIDVVFNLLIFFMLTAVAVPKGVNLDLPGARTATVQKDSEATISLDKDNRIYFNQREVGLSGLKSALQGLAAETKIVVRGDRAISYGLFVKVMDLIRENGAHAVVLSAEDEPGPESQGHRSN